MDIPSPEQSALYTKHIKERMGEQDALVGSVNALGLIVGETQTGVMAGNVERAGAYAVAAYLLARHLLDKAGGRKLVNEEKRRKLMSTAELLRDAADVLDKMCA